MTQTRMNTSQPDKITSWNHIIRYKKNLQIGILLTDANMFASLLFLCLAGMQISNRNLSESMMEASKPANILRITSQ